MSRATALAYDHPSQVTSSAPPRAVRHRQVASGAYRLLGESDHQDFDFFDEEFHLLHYPDGGASHYPTNDPEPDAFLSYSTQSVAPRRRSFAPRIGRPSASVTPRFLLVIVASLTFFLVATPTLGAALSRSKDNPTLSGYVDPVASAGAKATSAQKTQAQGEAASSGAAGAQSRDAGEAPQPQAAQPPAPVQAQAATAPGKYEVTGPPSLSVGQIEKVLKQYGSPAAGHGQTLYDLGVKYGIDPGYALAFFVHESGCGTKGVARFTKSLGNIRWTSGFDNYEGYRSYRTWAEGMEDWYKLITDLYIGGWGLRTVDAIIPVYAPWGDNNHPPTYIASVKAMVDSWRGK